MEKGNKKRSQQNQYKLYQPEAEYYENGEVVSSTVDINSPANGRSESNKGKNNK